MVAMRKRKLTPDEYLKIERAAESRSDFLNGEMIAMPGGSEAHSTISLNLSTAVNVQSKGKPYRAYTNDMRVRTVGRKHYTYPDLTIAAPAAEFEDGRRDILINPRVVFEVLSPSTEAYDRKEKFSLYFGVESFREYVLISQDCIQVDRYFRRDAGDWVLTRLTDPNAVLLLESVPVEIPLSEIYDRVEFVLPDDGEEGEDGE